ncbi:MAG: pyridoxal phosphate-dependent aminotransferase [Deltaproteobacteria bacterium]|nr:pyridoxal phosphate-dependent aminotransferase [Candidatus Anaeroferrophillacea bacterium]
MHRQPPAFPLSHKAAAMKSFMAMDILERATELERTGRSIIHLEVGQPDFPTPEPVKEAAARALAANHTRYTHSMGIIELREAISRHYRKRYGVEVEPDRILVTSGTSPALLMTCAAMLNPGDRMMLTNPGYACYGNFVDYCGGKPQWVPVNEATGFQYDPDDVKKRLTPATRGILVNSPANPSGTVLDAERFKALAEIGLPVISDEIYHGLIYDDAEDHTILEYTDNAFVLNGFSKLYAMTGWRLGYLIAPRPYIRTLQTIQQNFFIAACHFGQTAAITALESPEVAAAVEHMRRTYDERRRYLVNRVRKTKLKLLAEPTGAFYVFADARQFCESSYDFAFEILEKAGVGVTPGIDFGSAGEGYIRFTYANSLKNIATGMDRLEEFLRQR